MTERTVDELRAAIVAEEAPRPLNWSIYVLRDPETLAIRYVGFTTLTLAKRLRRHVYAGRAKDFHASFPIARWVRNLDLRGLTPLIELVEAGDGEWGDREQFHIARLKAEGCDLLNLSLGGYIKPAPEARKRAGKKNRGRIKSEEERRRISEGKLRAGTKRPDIIERNRRSGEWLRGRKLQISNSERERRRQSAIALKNKGHWLTRATPEERDMFARAQAQRTRDSWPKRRESAETRNG